MLSRRTFLQRASQSLAAGLVASRPCVAGPRQASRVHIGAQTNTWGAPIKRYDHLLEILDKLVTLGYQGFETNYMSLDAQAGRARQIRDAFRSRKIQFVAPHLAIGSPAPDDAELERLRRIAGYSAEMGAQSLIASGRRFRRAGGKLNLHDVRAFTETLNHVGRVCEREGLRFCYHNHIHEFQDSPPLMRFILQQTDPALVWLNYDIGNAFPLGPNPGEFSAQHFRRIAIYHIKDVKAGPAGEAVPTDFGAGSIDIEGAVAPLLSSNWEGWLIVEREGSYPHAAVNPEALLEQCRSYLHRITGL